MRSHDGTGSAVSMMYNGGIDHSGAVIGDFRLIKKLGAGGSGQVYSACQSGKTVPHLAVKIFPPLGCEDGNLRDRFRREFRLARNLRHPNLAHVLEMVRAEGLGDVLVMELVEGPTLDEMLRTRGKLSLGEAASVVTGIALGLAFMHEYGVIHRDVKPSNVVVRPSPMAYADSTLSMRTPVLVDFGSAKQIDDVEAGITARPGESAPLSYRYASPEQCGGEVLTTESDIYSLGTLAVELIAGEPPFICAGNFLQIVAERLTGTPRTLSEIDPMYEWPAGLQRVFDRVLSRSPADRFETAVQFSEALNTVARSSEGGTG